MDTTTKITTASPLVSIIMLTYNRANYISLALESAFAQTYQNFEIIILDDGSTDNTESVVASFSDPRIRYIKDTANKGLFFRRHESLSYVRGEYVAILDSDDIWSNPNKVTEQVALLEANHQCAVVGTFITLIDEHGHEIGKNDYCTNDKDIRNIILRRNQFANSSVMMRKSILDKTAGYRDFAPTEDFDLFLQLGRLGTFANLPEYMLAYRVHSGGESARKRKLVPLVLKVIALHKDAYPNYYQAWLKYTFYRLLILLKLK